MNKSRIFLILCLALGLTSMAGAAYFSRHKTHVSAEKPAPSASASAQTEARRTQSRKVPLLPVSEIVDDVSEYEGLGDRTTIQGIADMVLHSDPDLAAFRQLRRKALRTKDEQRRYHEMLQDRTRIAQAKLDLLEPDPTPSEEEELNRIYQVNYLASALAWEQNPERAYIVDSIREILFSPITSEPTPEQRKSLLGDRMELFQYLTVTDPKEASAIRDEVKGTPLEQVFFHAEGMLNVPSSPNKAN